MNLGFAARGAAVFRGGMDAAEKALEEARRAGIDLELIDSNLALPVAERWRQHDAALALILKLEQAKHARDAGLQPVNR